MTTYISLLRGINVSGQRIIKMEDLRKTFENLGFQNIRTYVQSGNVVFTAEESEIEIIKQNISRQIEKDFGFDVPVIVLASDKLEQIINKNPFLTDSGKDLAFMHVTFLASEPSGFDITKMEEKKQSGEEIRFSGDAVFLYCPHGYGKTRLSNSFLEANLKVTATTRNWKTTKELFKIAQQLR